MSESLNESTVSTFLDTKCPKRITKADIFDSIGIRVDGDNDPKGTKLKETFGTP